MHRQTVGQHLTNKQINLNKTIISKQIKFFQDMHNIKNNVQLIGHLGRNPEVKTLESGKKVARLLLATSEYRKNTAGEKETFTTWHNLTAWGGAAILAEKYLLKGKQIAVHGKLSNRMYVDKDGIKRFYTEVVVSDLQMIA